jgi:GT2 family glycosyltransferase
VITFSIVLYNNKFEEINKVINSITFYNQNYIIYLIDNSPSDFLKDKFTDNNIHYHFCNKNIGFGAGHNIAINLSLNNKVKFHFIVNPDIYFEYDVITPMINFMSQSSEIALLMPKILNYDKTTQFLPKLLPRPIDIIIRKIKFPKKYYISLINKYELRFIPENKILNIPIISGCFTLLNLDLVNKIGLYDDNFFMYFEDWDLSRRINKYYKTIYYPVVSVYHGYNSEANKNYKLFIIYIKSAIHYFNKWGWFFDNDRYRINSSTLTQCDK